MRRLGTLKTLLALMLAVLMVACSSSSRNLPATPTNFQSTGKTSSSATLSWDSVSGATSYVLERKSGAAAFAVVSPTASSPYTDTGLSPNTAYTYRLKAKNADGESAYTPEVTLTTDAPPTNPPGDVGNVSATPTSNSVSLTWSAPTTGGPVEDYTIERKTGSGSYGSPAIVAVTNYTDSTVAASTTYTYRIKARNSVGSSAGVEKTVTTQANPQAPGTPGNFQVSSVTANAVNLSWSAPTTGGAVSNYVLERKTAGGSYTTLSSSLTGTTYNDTGRSANTVYIYRLKASNASGSSPTVETAGTTLISASCAPGSSSDPSTKGCFGNVDTSWKAVPTHVAILPDGRVIYWYSMDNVGINRENTGITHDHTEVWIWDPKTNNHTQVNNTSTDLFCAGFAVLSDGRFFTAGGNLGSAWGSYRTNIFDPKTNSWTNGPNMNVQKGRWYPTVTKLADGKLLITGGSYGASTPPDPSEPYAGSFQSYYNKDIERYDPVTNEMKLLTPIMDLNQLEGYYPWWSVMPNGNVFLAGAAGIQILNAASTSGSWVTGVLSRDSYSRTYGSAVTYQPGKELVLGGGYPATNTSTFIDVTTNTPAMTAGPLMDQERTHANATLLADGQIFVNGGNKADSASLTCSGSPCVGGARWQATGAAKKSLLIDPNAASPAFRDAAIAARIRIYHSTAALLPDGSVLTAGGGGCGNCSDSSESYDGWTSEPDGNTVQAVGNMGRKVNQMNAEIYYPPYLFSGSSFVRRPTIQDVTFEAPPGTPHTDGYGNADVEYNKTFTITTPDAGISKVSALALSATTHSYNMNQRFVNLSFSQSGNILTVTSPQSGSYAPPGYYLIFILKNGVPSISRIVRFS